jgi:NAD(P)-dependent dehydrogenase (short-subunit alcohol dehydrogenase family)
VTRITSPFGHHSTALQVVADVDLSGRTALVTGAASGLGVETARALVAAGASVVLPVRSRERGELAVAEIRRSHPDARLALADLDLADVASVRAFGAAFVSAHPRLDILINNAAVMATPLSRTTDGFELQFGTNHLGHFELFRSLLPALRAAGGARVVALSSIGHRRSDVDFEDPNFTRREYDKWVAYGQSKTACALFAVGVSALHGDDGILANAVHPGGIMTGLQQFLPVAEQRALGWIGDDGRVREGFKTPEQGAATSLWAAVGPELDGVGGRYLEDCAEAGPFDPAFPFAGVMAYAVDPGHAERLWELSARLLD